MNEEKGENLKNFMVVGLSWTWHFHSITMIDSSWVISSTGHITIGPPYHP